MFMAFCFIEVEEMALEHNFVTLRRNYSGYNAPDDYSTEWNLVMENVRYTPLFNVVKYT